MVTLIALFLLGNYLHYWRDWPAFFSGAAAWMQWLGAAAIAAAVLWRVRANSARSPRDDAAMYARAGAYLIRAAFWGVFLIGLCDALISFLRVEDLLEIITGKALAIELGKPRFRGMYVHYPLLAAALLIAAFSKSAGYIWLAVLVVMAEFLVVVSRFVFSYEQAFMGDLVRFWYAALFLFASAHTLAQEGHVRVDVLYANFSARAKAMSNTAGALLLGLPLCWTIMLQGTSGKGASIVSPLLGFEISQSGYGMYVKYLMAGFLLVFAVSMALQFISAFLENAEQLREPSERTGERAGAAA